MVSVIVISYLMRDETSWVTAELGSWLAGWVYVNTHMLMQTLWLQITMEDGIARIFWFGFDTGNVSSIHAFISTGETHMVWLPISCICVT